MNKCDSCLMLREANTLKIPVFKLMVDINKPPEYCRKCYQNERNKFKELKKAYGYRLYIDACHAMKRVPKGYSDWLIWTDKEKCVENNEQE